MSTVKAATSLGAKRAARTITMGQDDVPFVLDYSSAESMLRAFAIVEAHMRTAKGVLETSKAWADASGLTRDVVFFKDQMAKLQPEYDRVREAAALTYLDRQPRNILMSDWDMLKILDDTSASIAWKAGEFWVEKGMPRNSSNIQPAYPETIAAGYSSGGGGIGGVSTVTVVAVAAGALALIGGVAALAWPS